MEERGGEDDKEKADGQNLFIVSVCCRARFARPTYKGECNYSLKSRRHRGGLRSWTRDVVSGGAVR